MAEHQFVRIKIPKGYDPSDFKDIGQDIITLIRDRCDEGVGVKRSGRSFRTYDFPDYTPEYQRKTGKRNVDLKLSEDMLSSIRVLEAEDDAVIIGFKEGSKENAKAEGNQIGSYGRKPDPKKARRFLGITKEELDAVLAVYDRE